MDNRKDIAATGVLTARALERLGAGSRRAYPIERSDSFADVLGRLDAIDWPPADKA